MGSLLQETPQSEVNATLEALGQHGITREHLKSFRKNSALQEQVAGLIKKASEQVAEVIAWIAGVVIPAKPAIKVVDCFKGGHIAYRDGDLGKWLARGVPAVAEGKSRYFTLPRAMQNREIAAEMTGKAGTDEEQKEFLKKQGKTYHLGQVDDLLLRTDKGENTGLLTNGWANIFFVEDEEGNVFVVRACRDDDGWGVCVGGFGHDDGWFDGYRGFSRN